LDEPRSAPSRGRRGPSAAIGLLASIGKVVRCRKRGGWSGAGGEFEKGVYMGWSTTEKSAHPTKRDAPPCAPRRRPFRPHFTYLVRLVLARSRCAQLRTCAHPLVPPEALCRPATSPIVFLKTPLRGTAGRLGAPSKPGGGPPPNRPIGASAPPPRPFLGNAPPRPPACGLPRATTRSPQT
jgi:hypothetical protein